MDASRPKASLADGEAVTLVRDDVAGRHPNVVELQLAMALLVLIAEHRKCSRNGEARRAHRHQNLALTTMRRGVRVGLAHHDKDLAVRVHRSRDPPLASVQHVAVTVTLNRQADVRGVRRRDIGLGHGEGGADFAFKQWTKPHVFLLIGTEHRQHFHVAGVGRRAVHGFSGNGTTAHDFAQRRVLKVGEPRTPFLVRLEQVPKPAFACFKFQFLHDGGLMVLVARRMNLGFVDGLIRVDALIHEGEQLFAVVDATI